MIKAKSLEKEKFYRDSAQEYIKIEKLNSSINKNDDNLLKTIYDLYEKAKEKGLAKEYLIKRIALSPKHKELLEQL